MIDAFSSVDSYGLAVSADWSIQLCLNQDVQTMATSTRTAEHHCILKSSSAGTIEWLCLHHTAPAWLASSFLLTVMIMVQDKQGLQAAAPGRDCLLRQGSQPAHISKRCCAHPPGAFCQQACSQSIRPQATTLKGWRREWAGRACHLARLPGC